MEKGGNEEDQGRKRKDKEKIKLEGKLNAKEPKNKAQRECE
jgi:hypothetical protein